MGSEEAAAEEKQRAAQTGKGKEEAVAVALLLEEGALPLPLPLPPPSATTPSAGQRRSKKDDAYDAAYWRERIGAALGAVHARAAALAAGKVMGRF